MPGATANQARASVGAGFIYAICGEMRTMPGLASNSAAERMACELVRINLAGAGSDERLAAVTRLLAALERQS
jgi:Formate--tetrahydrofolate ligase